MNKAEAASMFSVIGDNPIVTSADDWLNFNGFVQPLVKRLIASLDNTPFTVGVLADWGQGKTSVMRMLQLKLEDYECPTVWFEPWKYNSREEVWKGLAYTLLNEIRQSDNLKKEIRRKAPLIKHWAAKFLWSKLLGKQGVALIDAVQKEPWSPKLLHEFESTLGKMFTELYPTRHNQDGDDFGRPLVLFVDDLDRCLPNTALAVLEAMKLVLNRSGMIIIMGVAEDELSRAVTAAYAKEMAELEETINTDWGHRYVRKIFQIPICVPPLTPYSLNNYVEQCLRKSQLWSALEERGEWCPIIHSACKENLREIKRLINIFITEMDKAAANAELANAALDPTRDAARVFFVQLLAKRFPGFYNHILQLSAQERDILIRYQSFFLTDDDSASKDALGEIDSAFHDTAELRQFFQDCFGTTNGAPLVNPFSDPLEVSPFLQFGLVRTEADTTLEAAPPPTTEGEETALPGWVVEAVSDIQNSLASANYDEAEHQAKRAIERALKAKNEAAEAALLSRLSEVQQLARRHKEAADTLKREIMLYEKLGNKRATMNSARFLAKSFRHINAALESLEASQKAIAIAEELNDTYARIDALGELGRSLLQMERFDEAEKALEEVKRLSGSTQPKKALEAELLMALINRKQGDLEAAEQRAQMVLDEAAVKNDRENMANALQFLSSNAEDRDDKDKALELRMKENEIRQRLGDRFLELDSLWGIVRLGVLSNLDEKKLSEYRDALAELAQQLGRVGPIVKQVEQLASRQPKDEKRRYLAGEFYGIADQLKDQRVTSRLTKSKSRKA
jgi:tetratricopeptide (TPR) repeat protein